MLDVFAPSLGNKKRNANEQTPMKRSYFRADRVALSSLHVDTEEGRRKREGDDEELFGWLRSKRQ